MGEMKEFLQSESWLRLQEAVGKEAVPFGNGDFSANGIVHALPLVGEYLYIPRGPRGTNFSAQGGPVSDGQFSISQLIEKAKEQKCHWVRVEPMAEEILEAIKKSVPYRVVKAPHDMQPREVFKIDILPAEEVLLANMKSKTRYNIRLAEKRGVKVFETREEKYIEAFLNLITVTSDRKGITAHPRDYYEKFFQILPEEMCRLFVAEYDGVVLSANLVIFYGDTVTYLHGGSSDTHRDVMAPYLLQWEQMKTAKEEGYRFYDFGGVRTASGQQTTKNKGKESHNKSDWSGITKFKTGFSSDALPTVYPGAYDIVLDSLSYTLYRLLQRLKSLMHFS